MPTWRGKRGNPVLWGRAFFAEMQGVAGDVGARHLIGEHAGAVVEVEAESDADAGRHRHARGAGRLCRSRVDDRHPRPVPDLRGPAGAVPLSRQRRHRADLPGRRRGAVAVRDHGARQRQARRLSPGRRRHDGVPGGARAGSRPISGPPTRTRWSSPPAARWRSTSPPTRWRRACGRATRSWSRSSSITATSCRGRWRPSAPGARVRAIPVTEEGRLAYDRLETLVTARTRIIAVTHASNVTGAVTEVGRLREAADAVGALLVLDGAQRAPHGPHRRPGPRLRSLRLFGPQDVRPDRGRRPVGPQGAAGRAAAVPGRRRDDPPGRDRALDLRPAAAPLRGRHARRSAR